MFTKISKKLGLGLVLLAGVLIMLALLPGSVIGRPRLAPAAQEALGLVCETGTEFNLETDDGFISTPDGNSVYMWGYRMDDDDFQIPGPVLCVDEGQTITVNLTNNLPEPVSIVFPGQMGVTASGDLDGLFTAEAAGSGGTASYTFTAEEPGTYLYESGTEPHRQVHMGLYGALIVRPALGANFAYNDSSTEFGDEYLLVLHEIDPNLHRAVEQGLEYDITTLHFRYWTVNGRAFPDSISDNGVPWLPSQPYGALVRVEANDPDNPGLPALIRYANAGMENHPFHPHGNHLRVIARAGRLLEGPGGEDLSMEAFSKTIGSGETYDLLFRWEDLDGFTSSGNPVPVLIPGLQNLVFIDGLTFYSGSPHLGEQDELPTGTTTFNECGEFYFPWHSHALEEFQNFDEGFGGLATILRVDPPGGCQ